MRKLSTLSAAAALVLLSACASSNNVEGLAGSAGACIGCHGGANGDTSGAPPVDAEGLTTSAAVGAHAVHLATGVACTSCHQVPGRGDAPLHNNGTADVIFSGVAIDPTVTTTTPIYDPTTHTCSNVYCHAQGGSTPAPAWNAPAGSVQGCGDCHVATPHGGAIGTHTCNECHASSFEPGAATTIVGPTQGGTHANGRPDVDGHAAGWTTLDANGVTPHGLAALYLSTTAYPNGLDDCRDCHGPNLNDPAFGGTTITSCDTCHTPSAPTAWRTDCSFCHGDRSRLSDGLDAGGVTSLAFAPPRDVGGDIASAKVGAHQTHLYAGRLLVAAPVACGSCHVAPTNLSHVNGTPSVTLLNPLGGASGTYTSATKTCASTYCHGNFTGGVNGAPAWSDAAGSQTCSSCHGMGPATGRHPAVFAKHRDLDGNNVDDGVGTTCVHCHFRVVNQVLPVTSTAMPAFKNPLLHVNGAKDVSLSRDGTTPRPTGTPDASYVDGWNGSSCSPGCHGQQTW